jgi:hypothetical protein
MELPKLERKWSEHQGFKPPGCARAWMASVDGQVLSAVFELNTANVMHGDSQGNFVVAYQIQGAKKAVAERHPTFALAQQRANAIMDAYILIPRRM